MKMLPFIKVIKAKKSCVIIVSLSGRPNVDFGSQHKLNYTVVSNYQSLHVGGTGKS